MRTVIYYDPSSGATDQMDFRGGEAWMVNPDPASPADENFGTLKISAVTYQGLIKLGVVHKLEGLPHDGLLGEYEEGILTPEALPRASEILISAAGAVGRKVRDVRCMTQVYPRFVVYRMKLPPE